MIGLESDLMFLTVHNSGHRTTSSDGRNEDPEEDETVVDSEQGNGSSIIELLLLP